MIEVDVVVFDWYNTLAAPHPDDFWTRLPGLIAEAGGTPNRAALLEWEDEHPIEHVEYSRSEVAYRAWQRERFERLLRDSGINEPALTHLAEEVEQFRYSRLFEVFDDVGEVLRALRQDGIVIGICSNWDWDLDRHLRHNRLDDLVDIVVCSAIHGHRKPHPAIFDTVKDLAKVPAERILFVGDNLHDDIGGATSSGLPSVHINRDGSCQADDHADVASCVGDLRSLRALLG